jgi:hypothetical protein
MRRCMTRLTIKSYNKISGYFNGINAVNTFSLVAEDNEVHMRQDNTANHWQSGISISGTSASDILNNVVDMSSASTGYWQAGIAAHTNLVPKIHCNSITNPCVSIRIDHDNTTASNDGVRSNYMKDYEIGIWLVNGGEIGNQAGSTGSNSSDNVWATNTLTNKMVYSQTNSNPFNNVFFTRSGGGFDLPLSKVFNDGSFGCNSMSGNNSSAAGTGTACIANAVTPTNTKMAGEGDFVQLVQRGEDVALDYNQVADLNATGQTELNALNELANNEASAKANKYRNLLSNIVLQQINVETSPALSTFMNLVTTQNTGLLFAVDSLIHHAENDSTQISLAQNVNTAITPANRVEQSQQQFNALYLSYLAQHKTLSAIEVADLEDIAIQCPTFYGTSVYQARVVLFDLKKQSYRSNCESVAPGSSSVNRMNTQPVTAAADVSLFPNPANTAIYVNTGNYSVLTLKLYDMVGHLVLDKKISNNEKTDIEKLSNGMYIYKLYENDTELKVGKLIITH